MGVYQGYYSSPLGMIEIKSTNEGVTSVQFVEDVSENFINTHIEECIQQLEEYFNRKRTSFSLNLCPSLTAFQQNVLHQLSVISYGKTQSYSQLAASIGQPASTRAVANAIGKNPIAIIIPCHRVIGKNKDLRGYAWGKWRKEKLIALEQIS
ncbi:methylated-DNA--[protein]-cysteine S-methyltransferase [Jeotgalibacillus proteolyticus]|nr:methylated-DNA--[protein]-cysteine S-methyltransferase [Jeotgalibacillus proteolyticus]